MSERVSDERLAELAAHFDKEVQRMRVLGHHKDDGDILVQNNDTATALRSYLELRAQHREIICRNCYLRDQIGHPDPVDF